MSSPEHPGTTPNSVRSSTPPVFRPASIKDFLAYARNLATLTGLPLQTCQEELARLYGSSGLHELQAVMARPGVPGPYEDCVAVPEYESPPRTRDQDGKDSPLPSEFENLSAQELPHDAHVDLWYLVAAEQDYLRERQRTNRSRQLTLRIEGLLSRAGIDNAPLLAAKVLELGLFRSPADHRECCRRLGLRGTAAAEIAHWPRGMWGLLERMYALPYVVEDNWLVSRMKNSREDYDRAFGVYHPSRMSKSAMSYAAPHVYLELAEELPSELATLGTLWDEHDFDGLSHENWTDDHNPYEDGYADVWTRWVIEYKGRGPGRRRAEAAPSKAELEEITAYRTSLSPDLLAKNRFLQRVPHAELLARHWRAVQLRVAALESIEEQERGDHEIYLYRQQLLVLEKGQPPSSVGCYVGMKTVFSEFGPDNPAQMWEGYAAFVREPQESGGVAVPFAVLNVAILCPSVHGRVATAEEFFEEADASSQRFCTAAELVLHDYLPSHNYRNLQAFCRRHPGKSFAFPWLVMDQAYTGNRLTAPLLTLWLDTLNGHEHLQLGAASTAHLPGNLVKRLESSASMVAQNFQPPGVLFVPAADADADDLEGRAAKVKKDRYLQSVRQSLPVELVIYDRAAAERQ